MADVKFKGTDYYKVKTQDFRSLLSSEVHEIQDIQSFEGRESTKLTVGDGPSGESWKVVVKSSEEIRIQPGIFTHNGNVLHLSSPVDIKYNDNTQVLTTNARYIVFCTYKDVEVSYLDDPDLKDPSLGETSTRMGREYTFGVHKEWTPVSVGVNYIPLSYFTWTNSVLSSGDLFDLRFKFAQHYVVDGFNVSSYSVDGSNAVVTLEPGSFSYLGSFKRLTSPTDDEDLKFEIPLASLGTQSRYRIGYELSSHLSNSATTVKVSVSTVSTSTHSGPFVSLYNITVDSSGAVESETNDVRRYEPLTRRIASNKSLALADVSFLKPMQSPSPNMGVTVNEGWYFFKGVYKFYAGGIMPHDTVSNVGKHRLDVAGLSSSNVLTLYKGTEVATGVTPTENTSVPDDFFRLYQVIISDTTSYITDPASLSSPTTGEIKDFRKIFDHFPSASTVGVDRSGFAGTSTGGLPSTGTSDSTQEVLDDIDNALVSKQNFTNSLGITTQEGPSDVTFNSVTGKITLGHENYTGGNSDPATKVGIAVEEDSLLPNKVIIKNTWDSELRKLSSGGVVPTTMHSHPGAGAVENGAPIVVNRQIVEGRIEDRIAFISDFVVDEVLNSPFALIEATESIPTHINLNINTGGALELTESGFTVKVDSTKGLKTSNDGLLIYTHATQSGLDFIDDGTGDCYLKVQLAPGFTINGSNEIEYDLAPLGGLVVDPANGLAVGEASEIVNTFKGLGVEGSSPSEKLIVKRLGAIDFDGAGYLKVNLADGGDGTNPGSSFLLEQAFSIPGDAGSYLRVNINENKGLEDVGGALAVNLGAGLSFSGAGAVDLDVDSLVVADPETNKKGLEVSSGTLGVKLEATTPSLKVAATGELGVKLNTASGLAVTASGLEINLESTNSGLEFTGVDPVKELALKISPNKGLATTTTGLEVKLASGGGLEHSANGLKTTSGFSPTGTIYLFGGEIYDSALVTPEVLTDSFNTYDVETKTFNFLANPTTHKKKSLGSFGFSSDNTVHVFGGTTNFVDTNDSHFKYDIGTMVWTTEANMNLQGREMASVNISDSVGIMLEGTAGTSVEAYQTSGGWTNIGSSTGRDGVAAATSNTDSPGAGNSARILYFGGNLGVTYYNELKETVIDDVIAVGTTSLIGTVAPALQYASAFKVVDDEIMVVGGRDDSLHYTTVFQVDNGGTSTSKNPLPFLSKSDMASVVNGGKAFFFGGITSNDSVISDILSFDIATETWSFEGKTMIPIRNSTATIV